MNDVANKVATLMEAMPYLKKYAGKVIVIKYGGNAMINEELKAAVLQDVVMLKLLGMKPVLSHGGEPASTRCWRSWRSLCSSSTACATPPRISCGWWRRCSSVR